MPDKEKGNIVDIKGNILKSTKENKIEQFFKSDIWNILETKIVPFSTIAGVVLNLLNSKNYSNSCANFYGIDRRYFSGTEMFEDKVIFVLLALSLFVLTLFAYPFLRSFVSEKLYAKVSAVVFFIVIIFSLFVQNLIYTTEIIDSIPWDWMKKCIDNYAVMGIFLISDILLAYFIIKNGFFLEKNYKLAEKVIFTIVFLIYVVNMTIGITIKINYDISDKKTYEVIENNKAIVSSYDGKFVVMDCEIQDETIFLKKGMYSLEEMVGVSIICHKYDKVICE